MPKALEETIRIPRSFADVEVRKDTVNEAERTVEVVWTTEHPVRRRTWNEGDYMEVLACDPKAIRMDRFRGGMSLLDSHDNWSMANRLGTIVPESVRIEGKKGYATVKFSRSGLGDTLFQDLLDGHPIPISVGYRIHKFEKAEGSDKALPTLRATDWEPLEISAVPIPADPNAYTRSDDERRREDSYEVVLIRQADDEVQEPVREAAPTKETPMNKRAAAKTLKGKELEVLALGAGLVRNENETDDALSKRLLEAYDEEDRVRAEGEAAAQRAAELTQQAQQTQQTQSRNEQTQPVNGLTTADVDTAVRAAQERERKRASEISSLAREAGVSETEDFVRTAISTGQDTDAFRAALLDHLIKRENTAPTFPISSTRGMRDAQETTRGLMVNAIMHRSALTQTLIAGAELYRSMSLVDIGRELLMQRGENWRGAPVDIVKRSLHSTSDFPIILGEITRQTMMNAYTLEQEQNTFQLIASRNVMPDLREVKVLEMGNGPELEELTEKGEYRRGTIKESQEGFSIRHFGKIIGLTEAMIINDQLGAFANVIANWGRVVARLEGNIVWSVVLDNMKLKSDQLELFHASRGNLVAGTALTEAALVAGRVAFRKMKDIDGQQISIAPTYLFVGTDNEVPAQKLIQGITSPTTPDQVVPQAVKSLQPVYESRIDRKSSKAWYLFATPQQTLGRGLQYSYLSGYEAPRTMERYGFEYDGVEYRLDHYFGAGLTDYRFGYSNPGN
ncbi:hypothetical protein J2045_003345 [Peteryoungia aggregata LMG 23059]|uniref:Peptidase U35 phage prohead HK97 n=1 Tax=Peteryoungia aggregata LMG 23059 TaxID=1368425 RepID=A0ABU0GAB0_9HYPH|nr:prohead protease/major capsid protein fusion protein [Peteryoungia aggregata]MDQ0422297.1 hypothetical protein [Peteryoungia aggregata LMG 23059]